MASISCQQSELRLKQTTSTLVHFSCETLSVFLVATFGSCLVIRQRLGDLPSASRHLAASAWWTNAPPLLHIENIKASLEPQQSVAKPAPNHFVHVSARSRSICARDAADLNIEHSSPHQRLTLHPHSACCRRTRSTYALCGEQQIFERRWTQ